MRNEKTGDGVRRSTVIDAVDRNPVALEVQGLTRLRVDTVDWESIVWCQRPTRRRQQLTAVAKGVVAREGAGLRLSADGGESRWSCRRLRLRKRLSVC